MVKPKFMEFYNNAFIQLLSYAADITVGIGRS